MNGQPAFWESLAIEKSPLAWLFTEGLRELDAIRKNPI
jgi:hypothetical protein